MCYLNKARQYSQLTAETSSSSTRLIAKPSQAYKWPNESKQIWIKHGSACKRCLEPCPWESVSRPPCESHLFKNFIYGTAQINSQTSTNCLHLCLKATNISKQWNPKAQIEFITALPAQITSANNKMIKGIWFDSGMSVSFSPPAGESLMGGIWEKFQNDNVKP